MVCGHLDRNLLARLVTDALAGDLANLVTDLDPVPAPGPRCTCDVHGVIPRAAIPGALPTTTAPGHAATTAPGQAAAAAPGQPATTRPVPPGLTAPAGAPPTAAPGTAAPGTAAPGGALTPGGLARLQDTLLRYAVSLLSGPAGLAAYLRTQLTGGFFPAPSLPLDLGAAHRASPPAPAPRGDQAGPALLLPRLHRTARPLSRPSRDPPVPGRSDPPGQPDPAVHVSSPDRRAPLGLDPAPARRRHHHRHQPRRPQDPPQPRPPTRPGPPVGRPGQRTARLPPPPKSPC